MTAPSLAYVPSREWIGACNPTREIRSDLTRSRRYLAECAEYLGQLRELEDPDLLEQASAALWDLILERTMAPR